MVSSEAWLDDSSDLTWCVWPRLLRMGRGDTGFEKGVVSSEWCGGISLQHSREVEWSPWWPLGRGAMDQPSTLSPVDWTSMLGAAVVLGLACLSRRGGGGGRGGKRGDGGWRLKRKLQALMKLLGLMALVILKGLMCPASSTKWQLVDTG